MDNASTHKTPAIQRWRVAQPRFSVTSRPSSSSWLNPVERWFSTRKVLQRRVDSGSGVPRRTPLGPRGRARLVAAVPDGRSLWRAKVRATDDHLAATSPRIRLRTG